MTSGITDHAMACSAAAAADADNTRRTLTSDPIARTKLPEANEVT